MICRFEEQRRQKEQQQDLLGERHPLERVKVEEPERKPSHDQRERVRQADAPGRHPHERSDQQEDQDLDFDLFDHNTSIVLKMRRWLMLWTIAPLVACGGVATPPPPEVEVRREPVNREALETSLAPSAAKTERRASGPPPEQPVAPPAAIGQCLRSRMCGFEGLCSPGEEGLCIAASDEDCDGSDACHGGRCSARDGVCIAATDEDCRGSWACKGWGRCFHDGQGACQAKLAEDCRASTRCSREGECQLAGDVCAK